MVPNPFSGLIHSRKFWLAILDCVSAIMALWIGSLVAKETAVLIMGTWAAIQPVFITIIAAIAYEDKAAIQAEARVQEAREYNELQAKMDALEAKEKAAELTKAYVGANSSK